EGVRTRPDEADRAQAALVPALEVREVGLDRLRALQVEDRTERAVGDAALQLLRRPHDAQRPLRADEQVGHRRRLERRAVGVDRPRERELVRRRADPSPVEAILAGDEDGEEARREAALSRAGHVEVARVRPLEEAAAGAPHAEERVVVAVDDRWKAHPSMFFPSATWEERC